MDAPLADRTESRRPGALRAIAVRVAEVGERPIDRVKAEGASGDDHARAGVVPDVAGVDALVHADVAHPHPLAGGQVADAEDQRLQPWRTGGDLLDPGQRFGLFDQQFKANAALGQAELEFELRQQRIDEPDVARRLHFGHDDHVDVLACAGHRFDDVVVAPDGVRAVDAHCSRRLAPVQPVEGVDHRLARAHLFARRNRIFEVEEDKVGVALGGLGHHLFAGAGGGEFGSAKAEGSAHLGFSWSSSARISALCSPSLGGRR